VLVSTFTTGKFRMEDQEFTRCAAPDAQRTSYKIGYVGRPSEIDSVDIVEGQIG
jgi:hypothetical protein